MSDLPPPDLDLKALARKFGVEPEPDYKGLAQKFQDVPVAPVEAAPAAAAKDTSQWDTKSGKVIAATASTLQAIPFVGPIAVEGLASVAAGARALRDGTTYREEKDWLTETIKGSQAENPWSSAAGTTAGIVAGAVMLRTLPGPLFGAARTREAAELKRQADLATGPAAKALMDRYYKSRNIARGQAVATEGAGLLAEKALVEGRLPTWEEVGVGMAGAVASRGAAEGIMNRYGKVVPAGNTTPILKADGTPAASSADFDKLAKNLYQEFDNAGVVIRSPWLDRLSDDISRALQRDAGYYPKVGGGFDLVTKELGVLKNLGASGQMRFGELEAFRQKVRDLGYQTQGVPGKNLRALSDKVSDYLTNTSGNGLKYFELASTSRALTGAEARDMHTKARTYFQAARRTELLENVLHKAQTVVNSNARASYGDEIQKGLVSLLSNKKHQSAFTAQQRQWIADASKQNNDLKILQGIERIFMPYNRLGAMAGGALRSLTPAGMAMNVAGAAARNVRGSKLEDRVLAARNKLGQPQQTRVPAMVRGEAARMGMQTLEDVISKGSAGP